MPTSREIRAAEAAVEALTKARLALFDASFALDAAPDLEDHAALCDVSGEAATDAIISARVALTRRIDALRVWIGLYGREAA